MNNYHYKLGDKVRLIKIPEWLINDLPEEDVISIKSCMGKIAHVIEIDSFGYIWLDFNISQKYKNQDNIYLKGAPLFCVTQDELEIAKN